MTAPTVTIGIILAARDGDRQARDTLIIRSEASIRSICRSRTDSRTDLDDCSQRVVEVVMTSIHKLKDPHRYWGWVKGIAINTCRSEGRRARHWREIPTPEAASLGGTVKGPDEILEKRWELDSYLNRLDDRERTILYLREVEDWTSAEVAEGLRMKESTVRVAQYYALRKCRQAVAAA